MSKFALKAFLLLAPVLLGWAVPGNSRAEAGPYFLMGDGTLTLQGQTIAFRKADGSYDQVGLKQINLIFKADWARPEERMDLRFIEVLDYVQDQLRGGNYQLKSGYRNPRLNQSLRKQGKLAAQSSMHIEAAAGDLILSGVNSQDVFNFVKGLDCCGIGFYHGRHFHLDTGPSRYWDETSSKTEDTTPQENEKIVLQSERDRYQAGETMGLKFLRVTNYPIGVDPKLEIVEADGDATGKSMSLENSVECRILSERAQARTLSGTLPPGLKPGRYAFKVRFCNRYDYAKMPESILSRPFEIKERP